MLNLLERYLKTAETYSIKKNVKNKYREFIAITIFNSKQNIKKKLVRQI